MTNHARLRLRLDLENRLSSRTFQLMVALRTLGGVALSTLGGKAHRQDLVACGVAA